MLKTRNDHEKLSPKIIRYKKPEGWVLVTVGKNLG